MRQLPLSAKLDAPVSQVAFSFGLLSLGLAISSSVAGKLQERVTQHFFHRLDIQTLASNFRRGFIIN